MFPLAILLTLVALWTICRRANAEDALRRVGRAPRRQQHYQLHIQHASMVAGMTWIDKMVTWPGYPTGPHRMVRPNSHVIKSWNEGLIQDHHVVPNGKIIFKMTYVA